MIEIRNLAKKFCFYDRPRDRIKEWLSPTRRAYHRATWALQGIDLTIPAGETFGLIGMNGAGKSTFLKILTGTMAPTTGEVHTSGSVAALLELGTGFHPGLTGRDNVRVNGRLLGFTADEIEQRMDGIFNFSELGPYFDRPVRTYSTGMYVRLAFSLATAVQPDILIIDEALSVGDAYFQQKCMEKISAFKQRGTTILFVSHDLGAVKLLCDRVAILDQGRLRAVGLPAPMLEYYNALLGEKGSGQKTYRIQAETPEGGLHSGDYAAEITGVSVQSPEGKPLAALIAGQACQIQVDVRFAEDMTEPTVGILIRDRLGYDIFGTNTAHMAEATGSCRAGETKAFSFHCALNLGPGEYTLTAAVHTGSTHVGRCYHWGDRLLTFTVVSRDDLFFEGVSYLHPRLVISDRVSI